MCPTASKHLCIKEEGEEGEGNGESRGEKGRGGVGRGEVERGELGNGREKGERRERKNTALFLFLYRRKLRLGVSISFLKSHKKYIQPACRTRGCCEKCTHTPDPPSEFLLSAGNTILESSGNF